MLGMAAPVVAAPKYFFAPIGGWHSEVIVNPMECAVEAVELEQYFPESAFDSLFIGGTAMQQPFIYGWKG